MKSLAHSTRRDWLMFVIPTLSIFWLVLFYSYCFRVRIALGRWPRSLSDDGGLGSAFHYHFGFVLLVALFLFVPIASMFGVGLVARLPRFRNRRTIGALLVPWVIWAFVTFIDPRGLYVWYLD